MEYELFQGLRIDVATCITAALFDVFNLYPSCFEKNYVILKSCVMLVGMTGDILPVSFFPQCASWAEPPCLSRKGVTTRQAGQKIFLGQLRNGRLGAPVASPFSPAPGPHPLPTPPPSILSLLFHSSFGNLIEVSCRSVAADQGFDKATEIREFSIVMTRWLPVGQLVRRFKSRCETEHPVWNLQPSVPTVTRSRRNKYPREGSPVRRQAWVLAEFVLERDLAVGEVAGDSWPLQWERPGRHK